MRVRDLLVAHRAVLLVCIAVSVAGVLLEGYGQWMHVRDLVQQVQALPSEPTGEELSAILGPEVSQMAPGAALRVGARYTGVGLGALGALILWGVSVAASDRDRGMYSVWVGQSGRARDHASRVALLVLGAGSMVVSMVAAAAGVRVVATGVLGQESSLVVDLAAPVASSVVDVLVALLMALQVALSSFVAGVVTKSTLGGLLLAGAGVIGEVGLLSLGEWEALAWTPIGWRWALIHAFLPLEGGALTPPVVGAPTPLLALLLSLGAGLAGVALGGWLLCARRVA